MSSGPTDENLMRAYAEGDAAAFDLLYQRHRGPLFRFVLRQLGNDAKAEELFQDIWLKVIDARDRYETSAKFTTWFYRIARNRVIDEYRKQGRRPGEVDLEDAEPMAAEATQPDAQAAADESQAAFLAALRNLPDQQREVFLFRHEQGFSLEQIAQITEVNTETAKSRLRYAIDKLRYALTVAESDDHLSAEEPVSETAGVAS